MAIDAVTGEAVELMQQMIRNACVNDGTNGSETTSASVLAELLAVPGVEVESFEPFPGRGTMVARLPGTDPQAPSLCYLAHTDVVPAATEGWERDPFGGDLADGFVWGRGAIDMLNLTSTMAVAFRRLATGGFRPRGTLSFVASADEEAGGEKGAGWLLDNHPELGMADFTVTETGGNPMQSPGGRRLGVAVLEKGMVWCTVTVHGTPGHGSRPYRSDNALAKAAQVVERLAALRAAPQIVPAWRSFVEQMGMPAGFADPALVGSEIERLEDAGEAKRVHACTHTTFSPNVVRGGDKTNVIPDRVEVDVDVRTMPGQDAGSVRELILEALGPLAADVSINVFHHQTSNSSPTGTPLWDVLDEVAAGLTGGARLVPTVMTGCTDARFWRARGGVVYGFGLFSDAVTLDEHEAMFHGRNERVDLESLRLSAELWDSLARRFSEVSR